MTKCVKFWLKIINPPQRYAGACYETLQTLDEAGRTTWASKVKSMLMSFGFGHVWINQGVGDPDLFLARFRQRANDIARQTCLAEISTVSIAMYESYKTTLNAEPYMKLEVRKHRVALARLRTGSNSLAVNRLRGQVPRELRYCKYCLNLDIHVVEDRYHMVMVCPLFRDLRLHYLEPTIVGTVNTHTFVALLSSSDFSVIKCLSSFTYHAMKLHEGFMS